jgi:hypothetical protein
MGAEIPGFDMPNLFSGLTMSCFSRDGICKLILIKLIFLDLIIVLLLKIGPKACVCQSGLLTSKLPRQYE